MNLECVGKRTTAGATPRPRQRWRYCLPGVFAGILPLLLILILFLGACGGASPAAEADTYHLYRPAMKADAQVDPDLLAAMPRYDIEVTVDDALEELQGVAHILVTNDSPDPWTYVIFRLYPALEQYGSSFRIQSAAVNGQPVPFTYQAENTAVRVELPRALLTGQQVSIYFSWVLSIPHWEDTPLAYRLFGSSQGMVSLPLFYPSLAVYLPGPTPGTGRWWLERGSVRGDAAFNVSSLFVVTATLPSNQIPVTSGSLITSTTVAPGRARHVWVTGPVREFLLHMSDRFQQASTEAYGTRVTSYWLPGHEAAGRDALRFAAASLRIYSDHFGPYPYTDLRVAAAPLGFRGMEYPQSLLLGVQLYDAYRSQLEVRTAHEVAHEWWYLLVHNDPVNTPWMDEGLAEYATKIYYEALRGGVYAQSYQVRRWQAVIEALAGRGEDAPINLPVTAYENGTQYEAIVYGKAALFYDAIRQRLGPRQFDNFLRAYLEAYSYRIVTPVELWTALRPFDPQFADALYVEWIGALPPVPTPETATSPQDNQSP